MPEHGELPKHVGGGHEHIRAVAQDGEEEGGGQSVAKEGGKADPRGGERFDSHKGPLGLGQPLDKVGGGGDRGGEPVAQPPDLSFGRENRPVKMDRSIGDEVSIPVRSPVDELRFGDRKADPQPRPPYYPSGNSLHNYARGICHHRGEHISEPKLPE